jgi:6-phosphogluconate dehydrogenase
MELGMIGLGQMGAKMSRRLLKDGHHVVVYNRNPSKVQVMVSEGAVGAYSLEELASKLNPPRAVWAMVPAGNPTESALNAMSEVLSKGDTLIEGIATTATQYAAPHRFRRKSCSSSMSARAVACGA